MREVIIYLLGDECVAVVACSSVLRGALAGALPSPAPWPAAHFPCFEGCASAAILSNTHAVGM